MLLCGGLTMLPSFRFQGVYHAAGLGGPWYGSDNVIDSVRTRVCQTHVTVGAAHDFLRLLASALYTTPHNCLCGNRVQLDEQSIPQATHTTHNCSNAPIGLQTHSVFFGWGALIHHNRLGLKGTLAAVAWLFNYASRRTTSCYRSRATKPISFGTSILGAVGSAVGSNRNCRATHSFPYLPTSPLASRGGNRSGCNNSGSTLLWTRFSDHQRPTPTGRQRCF